MKVMPQIDELAPDLRVAEWLQGEPSNISEQKRKVVIIKVFQVNCPGCFSLGFPEIIESYAKYLGKPITFWGLATAFDIIYQLFAFIQFIIFCKHRKFRLSLYLQLNSQKPRY